MFIALMLGMFLAALDVAILIFLAGSMLAGLSQSMAELIGFRSLQGIGGMVLALVPFVLSWFLKEVPLRTTIARAAGEAPPEPSGQLAWESPDR